MRWHRHYSPWRIVAVLTLPRDSSGTNTCRITAPRGSSGPEIADAIPKSSCGKFEGIDQSRNAAVWMGVPVLRVHHWPERNWTGSSGPRFRPQKVETCPDCGANLQNQVGSSFRHSGPPGSPARIRATCSRRTGQRFMAARQTTSQSMPK